MAGADVKNGRPSFSLGVWLNRAYDHGTRAPSASSDTTDSLGRVSLCGTGRPLCRLRPVHRGRGRGGFRLGRRGLQLAPGPVWRWPPFGPLQPAGIHLDAIVGPAAPGHGRCLTGDLVRSWMDPSCARRRVPRAARDPLGVCPGRLRSRRLGLATVFSWAHRREARPSQSRQSTRGLVRGRMGLGVEWKAGQSGR
jgi:hypothetical protein